MPPICGIKKLKPKTAEEAELAKSPEGMRELIMRHSNHSPFAHTAAKLSLLNNNVGSPLDTMTILAFYAIIAMEELQDQYLELATKRILDSNIYFQRT